MKQPIDRHEDIQKRLAKFNSSSALMLTALVVLGVWGDWEAMSYVAIINTAVVAWNIGVTFLLLPRMGYRAEFLRSVVNISTGVLLAHITGWPLPAWFFLPFIALIFDHLAPRTTVATLVAVCAGNGVVALIDGVPWIYPLGFTVFAFFCLENSRLRFKIIRAMLVQSDGDRAELACAHENLKREAAARERAEIELRQAQKLQAVGRLASGVAHEINTPVKFVSDSVAFLRDAVRDLLALTERQQLLLEAAAGGASADKTREAAERALVDSDWRYLQQNAPQACDRANEGIERVAEIVRSMKRFAHPRQLQMSDVDLNSTIAAALTMAAHEYTLVADVVTELDASLPLVTCHASDMNHVILNLIVNAAHAIEDAADKTKQRGKIVARSRRAGDSVVVSIEDSGTGIPAHVQPHIFDPFFTTKEIGRGTGQGLAIAQNIVEKYGGRLTFDTAAGRGTTFFMTLPAPHDTARAITENQLSTPAPAPSETLGSQRSA